MLSQLRKALCAKLSAANADRTDFAEEPAAMVARMLRTISRMKVTNCLAALPEMDDGPVSGIFVEFRKNVGVNLRMTCRALARLPCNKQIERERFAAARTGEIGGHLAYGTGREVNHRLHRFEERVLGVS